MQVISNLVAILCLHLSLESLVDAAMNELQHFKCNNRIVTQKKVKHVFLPKIAMSTRNFSRMKV
jgi:hypothetical protein